MPSWPTNTAILLLAHGSRDSAAQAEFSTLVQLVQARTDGPLVVPAFLELAEPSLAAGVQRCVEAGARTILLLPLFLTRGHDVTVKLPNTLTHIRPTHPSVTIRVGDSLAGEHGPIDQVVALLLTRAEEATAGAQHPGRALLLVGRGSRNPGAAKGTAQVATAIAATGRYPLVEAAYAQHAEPSVPAGIARCVEQGRNAVVVVPYLLFPGHVMHIIERDVTEAQGHYPDGLIRMARTLGPEPVIADLVIERARRCAV